MQEPDNLKRYKLNVTARRDVYAVGNIMNGDNLEEERRAKKMKEEQRKQQVHADVSHYMKMNQVNI